MAFLARVVFLGVSAAVSAGVFACSGSTRSAFDADADGEDANAPPGPSGGGFSSSGDAGAVDSDGCSEEAKLVYVLSADSDLYSFAPIAKKFTKIGHLDCSLDGMSFQSISMAVDRKAVAWVNMRGGDSMFNGKDALFKVDTKTAGCTPSGIEGDSNTMGGMGFSTNDSKGTDETLFVLGAGSSSWFGPPSPGLHKVDFTAKALTFVADLQDGVGELTGTGDGRLYGFIVGSALGLVKIDKASGAVSDKVALTGVKSPISPWYAFSFWGGDFYFYTANDSGTATVARYKPSDGEIDAAYMDDIGFKIVGAGVSTCAPTGPK